MIINRVANVEMTWHKEMHTRAQVTPEFDFSLDLAPAIAIIEQLNFAQLKGLFVCFLTL